MRRTVALVAAGLITLASARQAHATATLMTGLGGGLGYGTTCMPPNDDGTWPDFSVPAGLDLTPAFPTGLHFYSGSYTHGWINNNGNLSFQGPISTYTPDAFPGAPQPMIAPYWADVDTRDMTTCDVNGYDSGGSFPPGTICPLAGTQGPSTNGVWWSLKPGQMVVTWDHVGVFHCQTTPTMTFQMILTAAGCNPTLPDGGIGGIDFDIEFRYNQCGWEAGTASGAPVGGFCTPGTVGAGCTPAQAGFDSAESPDVDYASLPMSRMAGISMELCNQSNLTPPQPGIWRFSVRGGVIECPMAGQPCQTGMPGVCAQGQLQCGVNGMTTCQPLTMPGPSQCNGLDNNCDGMIDNGPCPVNDVCTGAQCVPKCSEASCPPGNTCVNDICIETACVGVTCPAGKRCSMGQCVDDCSGVTCPLGQVCRLGSCVDPCLGLNCGQGQVCENGMCVPTCPCTMCTASQTCNTQSGRCVDTACLNVTCPMGQLCKNGTCIDECMGAVCPPNQICQTGMCVPHMAPPPDAGMGLMTPDSGPVRGPDGGIITGDGGMDAGGSFFGEGAPQKSGCACRTTTPGEGRGAAIGVGIGVLALLVQRRRKRSRHTNTP